MKAHLDTIVSHCQSGFIEGRYICDWIRLIYDAIKIAESKIMGVDFQKAFDFIRTEINK